MKKVIIFDFDGVIADTFDANVKTIRSLLNNNKKFSEVAEILKNGHHSKRRDDLGISDTDVAVFVKKVQQEMNKVSADLDIHSEMNKLLCELKRREYKIGILTSNIEENVYPFLVKQNIDFFDFICCGAGFLSKMNELKKVINQNNFIKELVYYIGDEARDIEVAKNCGVKSIAVTWGYNSKKILKEYKPDFLVDNALEILEIIK